MELRPELLPPSIAPDRIAELGAEIERIEELIHARGRGAAASAYRPFAL